MGGDQSLAFLNPRADWRPHGLQVSPNTCPIAVLGISGYTLMLIVIGLDTNDILYIF
jgi:hypothetical protein